MRGGPRLADPDSAGLPLADPGAKILLQFYHKPESITRLLGEENTTRQCGEVNMNIMVWKGKKLLKRHRIIMRVVLVAVIIFGFSTYLNNSYTGQKIKTHYLQAFEKKYWAELDILHAGSVSVVSDYFNEVYNITSRLTNYGPAVTAVIGGDKVALAKIIDQQHDVTGIGSGLFVLDKTGVVIAVNLDSDPLKQLLGTNASSQPYYKNIIETKRGSASKVYYTLKDGAASINYCAPFLKGQDLQAIVCSAVRLSALNDHFQAAALKSDYATFKSVVTDIDGNILFDNNGVRSKTTNIKEDRAVAALIAGAQTFRDEEINFEGTETFVEASRVDLGNSGGVFIIYYLPKSEATKELQLLDASLNRINTGNGTRSMLLTILAIAVIYWVIRKHDEETINS